MSKNKFKYFVLLANMRTGSNLFEQNVNLYDSLKCHGELFNPYFVGYPNSDDFCGMTVADRDQDPLKLIRKMISADNEVLPGFRLFSDHDQRVIDYVLKDKSCAKIILTRNPLDSFISHAIARKTDQWRLTDHHKRKTAKVDFDILGFKSYINRLSEYQKNIRTKLQISGQAAFQLSYTDLSSLDVFNGIADFLGSDEELESLKEKIKRQNPEDLSEKVNNYSEMVEQVKSVNFLDSGLPDFHEPERHAAAKNFILGDTIPLLFMPVGDYGRKELRDWMHAHLNHNDGSLLRNMKQRDVFGWLNDNPSRVSFSMIAHPVERVHIAFSKHIFSTGKGGFPWIRKVLVEQYNMRLPDADLCEELNSGILDSIGYGALDYREALKKFAKFLNGNLKGQTRARVDQSWASQTAILDGYSKILHPDYLIRHQNFENIIQLIEAELGLPNIAPNTIESSNTVFDLAQVYDDELEMLVKKAYARDYAGFGFKSYRL